MQHHIYNKEAYIYNKEDLLGHFPDRANPGHA